MRSYSPGALATIALWKSVPMLIDWLRSVLEYRQLYAEYISSVFELSEWCGGRGLNPQLFLISSHKLADYVLRGQKAKKNQPIKYALFKLVTYLHHII